MNLKKGVNIMLLQSFKNITIAMSIVCMISACGSTAHVEKTPGIELAKFKTYSWAPEDDKETAKNRRKQILNKRIHASVNKQLEKQGLNEVDTNPDVLISTDLVIEKSAQQRNDPVYSRPYSRTYFNRYSGRFYTYSFPSQFIGYDRYTTSVREGTITITLIDARTDQAVWQGWATRELKQRNISDKEIDKNVKSIFWKYD